MLLHLDSICSMELESREATWNCQISSIFQEDVSTSRGGDDNIFSEDLIGLHKKATRIWWNICSLEEYVKLGIVPLSIVD